MKALLVCCLAILVGQTAYGISPGLLKLGGIESNEASPQLNVPLGFQGENDVAMMFGLQVLQDLRNKEAECTLLAQEVKRKFREDLHQLQKSLNDTEEVISKPEFEEMSSENRKDIERTFHQAFVALRHGRDKKIEEIEVECERQIKRLMRNKVQQALRYAENIIQRDPGLFTKLMFEVARHVADLRGFIEWCAESGNGNQQQQLPVPQTAHTEFLPYLDIDVRELCEGDELAIMVRYIDQFIAKADRIPVELFGDDEDFGGKTTPSSGDVPGEQESGSSQENDNVENRKPFKNGPHRPHKTKPVGNPPDNIKLPSAGGYFMTTPYILELPEEDEKDKIKQGKVTTKEPVTFLPSTTTDKETSTTTKYDLLQIASNFFNSLEPGPVLIEDNNVGEGKTTEPPAETKQASSNPPLTTQPNTDPTTEKVKASPPEWVNDVFNEVEEMKEKFDKQQEENLSEEDLEEEEEYRDYNDIPGDNPKKSHRHHESHSDSREGSRSHSHGEEEDSGFHGSFDLDLPGVDAGVNVNVGSQGVEIDIQNEPSVETIIFDNEEETGKDEDKQDSSSFVSYILIYFFATLGSLLVLTILVLVIAIVAVRSKRRSLNDMSNLSAEEKVAIMKQTGYVNPTYKFFDNVDEV